MISFIQRGFKMEGERLSLLRAWKQVSIPWMPR